MKRILAIVALLTVALGALADNVTFVARAPRVVAVGEQFQLKFDVGDCAGWCRGAVSSCCAEDWI